MKTNQEVIPYVIITLKRDTYIGTVNLSMPRYVEERLKIYLIQFQLNCNIHHAHGLIWNMKPENN